MLDLNNTGSFDKKFIGFTKGFAIILIFFHHFARTLSDYFFQLKPSLNQWQYEGFDSFSNSITHLILIAIPGQFFYSGVGIFIFISGVGLSYKYQRFQSRIRFLGLSILKLVIPFYTTFIISYLYLSLIKNYLPFNISDIILKLSFFGFTNHDIMFIANSPLWCYDIFIILYVASYFLLMASDRFSPKFIVASSVVISLVSMFLTKYFFYQNYTTFYVAGAFPINYLYLFTFGFFFNKLKNDFKLKYFVLILFSSIFMYFMDNYIGFNIFIYLFTILIVFWFYFSVWDMKLICKPILFIGNISTAILLCHRPIINVFPKILVAVFGNKNFFEINSLGLIMALLFFSSLILIASWLFQKYFLDIIFKQISKYEI